MWLELRRQKNLEDREMGEERMSLERENVDIVSVEIEHSECELSGKGEGRGRVVVVMDTPERNKNQIATPISKFEDSPVFNFLNNLSPIKPVKPVRSTQTLNSLCFASLPSVFNSPHVSSIRESRFLRRHQSADPSKPEFSSDIKADSNEHTLNVVNDSSEHKENYGCGTSVREDSEVPSYGCSKDAVELARTLHYECSSPSTLPSCGMRSQSLSEFAGSSGTCVPLVQELFEKGLLRSEVNTDGISHMDQNKEAPGSDWEGLSSDPADVLILDPPNDPEAFAEGMDPNLRCYEFVSNEMRNLHNFRLVGCSEECGDGSEISTHSGEGSELKEYVETQKIIPGYFLSNDGMGGDSSEKDDRENVSSLYRGMRRRCLLFEMVEARKKYIDENSGSSAVQQVDGNPASNENQLVPSKTVNEPEPLRCILPGIGLHLNALSKSSKDGKVVKHEANASGKQLVIASGSAVNFHPLTTGLESQNKSLPVSSAEGEIFPFENGVPLIEDSYEGPGYVTSEEPNQSSPKKKKCRLEPGEDGACKRCNCKKSKCLKLYCECFAAGLYCVEPCSCQDCFNKPIYEDTVLATRKQIESRNPLAFAPKVIRRTDSLSETGEDPSKTPASARHKRGCNCKKSGCLKKYCECYQGGVGCSINCRCEGCKNAFGRKDGTDGDVEEEEPEISEKTNADRSSHKMQVQNDIEHNPESAHPATPLMFVRPPMQLPLSLKNKPPRSSFLSIGSSSGIYASQGIGRRDFFQPQPSFDKPFETIQEDEMPHILQCHGSPIRSVKLGSPNSKRVSPPHCDSGIPPSRRSSRKLILQSIPSFPSLTPNP